MSKVTFQQSVSLDGYSAGPEQSLENPLGIGGEDLHTWVVSLAVWREQHGLEGGEVSPSTAVMNEITDNIGAVVMGRNMFGGGPGPWDGDSWKGWWGDNPPFHTPVFVLTHFPREPLELEGGTTFYFVQDGIEAAIKRATEAAGELDVSIGGGAQTIQQAIQAGLVNEGWVHVAPVLLGGGTRFIDNIEHVNFVQRRTVEGDNVAHILYDIQKST